MTFDRLISLCQPTEVSGTKPDGMGMLRQDSRQVTDNDVFIAIRGHQVDGHDFIEEAIEKDASVIISEEPVSTEHAVAVLQVADTRLIFGPLAQAFAGNPANKLKVIGITGTNGKTTVATLVYQVLQRLEAKPALLGTVAKYIGDEILDTNLTTADPIELAADMQQMVRAGATHLVMEVSSHALEQRRVNGISFDVAAFTNLSHDHLDYHKNVENYARSKRRLFDSLDPGAVAIINGDDEQAGFMVANCRGRIIQFSFQKALDIECQILANNTSGLTIRIGQLLVESPLMGTFNAYNITQAFLIAQALGFSESSVVEALGQAKGASGRLESVAIDSTDDQPLVLVDYAHTPDALENVVRTLSELKTDRQQLHVVFGCGGNRDKAKRPKMGSLTEKYADRITVTSDNPRNEDPDAIIDDIMPGFSDPARVRRITDRKQAIIGAIAEANSNTIILIAGKGHETYQEINGHRYDFDDRQIARKALGNRNTNTKPTGA